MPRSARKPSATDIYHVMVRGINQQDIFEDAEDRERFMVILREVKALSGFELLAFCLMSNHIHLLIKEVKEPLSSIMRRLGARYVGWFNWRHQRTGHLFQDRFRSEPVETDAYFPAVLAYIHLNPVRAGISKRPEAYRFSSLHLLSSRDPLVDWAALERIVSISEVEHPLKHKDADDCLLSGISRRNPTSDADARALLNELCGADGASSFQRLTKTQQRAALAALHTNGIPIRQAARICGVSRGMVTRWCSKNEAG